MLALTLFIIAAWGWFCLAEFTDGAPLTGFLLFPVFMPFLVALILVGRACSRTVGTINDLFLFAADWERGL